MSRILGFLGRNSILVVLIALFLIFTILVGPTFLTLENLPNIARQISFDALVAFGQTICLIAGGIDISVGSVLSMSAALTMGLQPLGVGLAVAASLLFGIGVGVVNGLLVTRLRIVPFIATLGTMTLVRGLMLTYTRQEPIAGKVDSFTFWGSGSLGFVPVPFLIVLAVMLVLHIFLKYTRFGRNLYAIGGNKDAAHLAGIPVARHQFTAFVISGATASLAGVLLASRLNSSTIHVGFDTGLLSIAAAILGGASLLGGRGSVIGALLGVLALGMLANGMDLLGVYTYYQIAIRAIILLTAVAVDALYVRLIRDRLAVAAAAAQVERAVATAGKKGGQQA
jgi:ribose transport system permease protein